MDKTRNPWHMLTPALIGYAAIFILIFGLGLWSVRTELAGAIVSQGVVEVQIKRQEIEHPDGGVIGEIFVRDGDDVAAGELLLRLDDTFLSSERKIVEAQLHELMARRTRLEAVRDGDDSVQLADALSELQARENVDPELVQGQLRLFEARLETQAKKIQQLTKQKAQIESEIAGTQSQLTALNKQVELVKNELADQQSLLDRGLTHATRVTALQRDEANLIGEIGRLEATIARLNGQIASIEIQIVEIEAARREHAITTIREVQALISELSERRLALSEQLSRLDIRAPVAGTVYDSQVFALQSVIEAAEPIMYIVPQDTPLLIATQVDAIHVDQLHRGQDVALRFPAFNQRETPELDGVVSNVSADTFTDQTTGFTFYRAEVVMDDEEFDKLNGKALLPGMPVEAMIKTDERTPLSYLVKPLTDYFARAFRE